MFPAVPAMVLCFCTALEAGAEEWLAVPIPGDAACSCWIRTVHVRNVASNPMAWNAVG